MFSKVTRYKKNQRCVGNNKGERGDTCVEPVNKLKGVQGGLCNVTACQSDHDVNYCNQWHRNLYYCLQCAIRFTKSDKDYKDGYRINQFVPHPILCSQEEVKWFLDKRNTFSVEVELRDDGYWFNDFGDWFKVPEEPRTRLMVFDTHPMDPGTVLITRPVYNKGKSHLDLNMAVSECGVVWNNEVYSDSDKRPRYITRANEAFVVSQGEMVRLIIKT